MATTYPTTTEITDENGVTNTYDLTHVAMWQLELALKWKSAELLGLAILELTNPDLLVAGEIYTEGDFASMYLGEIYRLGHLEENDYPEAVKRYTQSGLNVKHMTLCGIYYLGRKGVDEDVAKANWHWNKLLLKPQSKESLARSMKDHEDALRTVREAARQAATTPTEDEDDTSSTPTDPADTGGTPDDGDTTTTPTGDDKDEDSSGSDNTP